MEKIPGTERFGLWVKARRQETRLRQQDVAALMGMSLRNYSRIEAGERGLASVGEEIALARALELEEEAVRAAAEADPVEQEADAPPGVFDLMLAELVALRQEVALLREAVMAPTGDGLATLARAPLPPVRAAAPPADTGGQAPPRAGEADGPPPGEHRRPA